jgi:glutamine amidotransferase
MRTGIIDYDAGNLQSVVSALRRLGRDAFVSSDPKELGKADRLVFPGDGHAATSMESLRRLGLDDLLRDFFQRARPILGICVGSQIVLDSSDETPEGQPGVTPCLGLVAGSCHRLPKGEVEGRPLKVPHMGWNTVRIEQPGHPLFRGIPDESAFYFVHSFYTEPQKSSVVLGTTEYGLRFATGFVQDSLASWQFHPEKSGEIGLALLDNFFDWRP